MSGLAQQARAGAALLAALLLPALLALLFDDRTLLDVSVWSKPIKFDLSLGLHLATVALLVGWVAPEQQQRRPLRLAVAAVVFCALLEALYITLQAARGRPSHYARQTALEAALYSGMMGPAAVAILIGSFVVGWWLWRHPRDGLATGWRYGGAIGLMLGAVATLAVVPALSSGSGHWVGGVRSDAGGLPLVGWAMRGGDLRVPHFFALHLTQSLPLVGWLADRAGSRRPLAWVLAAAAAGLMVVGWAFMQALSGRPIIAA